MSRPYLEWSVVQLEAEFERAQDAGDRRGLETLKRELAFRTTSRAKKLADDLQRFLGGSDKAEIAAPPRKATVQKTHSPNAPQIKRPKPQASVRSQFKPTEEQQQAIEHFGGCHSLKVNAYAGTGKTSTLEMLAHSNSSRHGQYIAFNKAIVEEAKEKFPKWGHCSTAHGLAFKATPSNYKNNQDKMTRRMNANQMAASLNLKAWQIDRSHKLSPRSQGFLVLDTIRRFAQSADPVLRAEHVPRHGSLVSASDAVLAAVTDFALHAAEHVWKHMTTPDNPMPLGHDGYLKLWALSGPRIAADYILLDEAQDTNPVVLGVLQKQDSQMIYVGDRYQQIYEWRGAVNAMERIETERSTYLTQSFRFGPNIAGAASNLLRRLQEKRPLTGNPLINSRIAPNNPQTILARSNASTIAAVIECLDAGRKPHLVGGVDDLMEMLRGVQDLKEGRQSTVPDFFGFDKWDQVVEFAKSGEGSHLLTFVNLVEARGEKQLMWALNRTVDTDKCDITISTAHKAKGKEWDNVRLMDDFMRSSPKQKGAPDSSGDPAELRLLYVALTRAKQVVEVPQSLIPLLMGR